MSETFSGQVDVQDGGAQTTIRLDGNSGDVSIGGGGQGGEIRLKTSAGTQRLNLNGDPGTITFVKPAGMATITLDGGTADISAGGGGEDGDLTLKSGVDDLRIRLDAGGGAQTTERIYLNGAGAEIIAGGNVNAGTLRIKGAGGEERIKLLGASASASFGGTGEGGNISLIPSNDANSTIVLDADAKRIQLRNGGENRMTLDGALGDIYLGGNGVSGNMLMYPSSAQAVVASGEATILLDAGGSAITIRGSNAKDRIFIEGGNSNIWMGGNGADGDLVLLPSGATSFSTAKATIHLDAGGSNVFVKNDAGKQRIRLDGGGGNIWLGGNGADGDLVIFPSGATNTSGTAESTIHLNGEAGDITLKNADCAEEFDIVSAWALDAGTVMVLDGEGALRESQQAYDKKVAGVLSGAGEYRPGIVLDKKASRENRRPVALMGKVYCKVDADCAPVEAGDLLTTSHTPGHAMKAADPAHAFGAVIGKALRPLKQGKGLIPILVALQ